MAEYFIIQKAMAIASQQGDSKVKLQLSLRVGGNLALAHIHSSDPSEL